MDNRKSDGIGLFDGVSAFIKDEINARKSDSAALLYDVFALLASLMFARCHIAFGAHPLGVVLVSLLSRGVWLSAIGGVAGALSLGSSGVVYAVMTVIAVFLRVIISGKEGDDAPQLFSEPLIFRISSGAGAAFIGAVYQAVAVGFSIASVLSGAFSVAITAALIFILSGIYDGNVGFSDFLFSGANVFKKRKSEKERIGVIFFKASFLLFCFLLSLSLKEYNLFGINLAYVFASGTALFFARRFGAFWGMATGFTSALAFSGVYSVGFALLGLVSGALFSINMAYAAIGGVVIISVWGIYAGGLMGFLSVFPECVTAALVFSPLIKKIKPAAHSSLDTEQDCEAENMVSTASLAYKTAEVDELSRLEVALTELSSSLRAFSKEDRKIKYEEYHNATVECAAEFCRNCENYARCLEENPAPCAENIDIIATKLYKNEQISSEDESLIPKYCVCGEKFIEALGVFLAKLTAEQYKKRRADIAAEEYELISRLIREARASAEREKGLNTALTDALGGSLAELGLGRGAIRVFGERKKRFIGAGKDPDGSIVTSAELCRAIEETAEVKLGTPEFYRKGETALFEFSAAPKFRVEFAFAERRASESEVSGDTVANFETEDGRFYSLISDGMGSGDAAKKTSRFAAEFLSKVLNASPTKNTAFHMLNHIMRSRDEECSATIDLFELDLYRGDALFFKCGAAASYVKRDSSIFRVRSETAPLGLMKSIDAERIKVEIKAGDYVVMISDGISQSGEDAAWLLEILNREPCENLAEYAENILSMADAAQSIKDDKSVTVLKICAV